MHATAARADSGVGLTNLSGRSAGVSTRNSFATSVAATRPIRGTAPRRLRSILVHGTLVYHHVQRWPASPHAAALDPSRHALRAGGLGLRRHPASHRHADPRTGAARPPPDDLHDRRGTGRSPA